MNGQVGIVAAFAAGVVSFLSPCVLPLLPAYISFVTGMSLGELTGEDRHAVRILGPVLLFVLGFTLVFVALGASASVLGAMLDANRELLSRSAGVVVAIFGVVLLDVVPLPWLHVGGLNASGLRRFGPWAALALGLAFPFALGPCAGPVYGAILTLAIDTRSVASGALLLLVYSAGLAIPFVAVSLLLGRLASTLKWFGRHARTINRIAGAVLIVMGVAMATGLFGYVARFLQTLPLLDRIG
jgi:cytochrome c-type biogenesis protein